MHRLQDTVYELVAYVKANVFQPPLNLLKWQPPMIA